MVIEVVEVGMVLTVAELYDNGKERVIANGF